jgi:hypothetical protein
MAMYRVTTTFSGVPVAGGGVNRLYFSTGGGTAQQAATAVVTWWNGVKDVIDDGLTMTVSSTVDTVNIENGDLEGQDAVTGSVITGTASEDPLPPQIQGVVRLLTGSFSHGSQIRGRIYIPGLTEGDTLGGTWQSTRAGLVTTAAAALIASANAELVVWRRPIVFNPPTETRDSRDGEFAGVTSAALWEKFASLRSRRD